jgi:uridine phosphorylase
MENATYGHSRDCPDWENYRAIRLLRGHVVTKCFFYLTDGSNSFVESLGLRYFDTESAAVYAVAIARGLQAGRAADALVVVATDQRGNEIARAPIRLGKHSTNGRSAYAEAGPYAGRKVARIA